MPHRTFFAFILPSLAAMLLFIALPIASIALQSLYREHDRVLVETETCQPLGGCIKEMRVDNEASARLKAEQPLGQFNGFSTYADHNHLAIAEVGEIVSVSVSAGWVDGLHRLYNLPFYRALAFTLVYTLLVTPLAMGLGFLIAIAVDTVPRLIRGPVVFFSLLPMVITPLIGSLILFWMINSEGIIGAFIQYLAGDPDLSLKASAVMTWMTLIVHGVWTNAPFSFIVFYAGLQTVPADTLESAMIDGASRFARLRYVVIPHLMPLATFIALVQLMDNFRVFEPIIGFNASANATSLAFIIFTALNNQNAQMFSSAAATSMLTIAGIVVLLIPILRRTLREFGTGR